MEFRTKTMAWQWLLFITFLPNSTRAGYIMDFPYDTLNSGLVGYWKFDGLAQTIDNTMVGDVNASNFANDTLDLMSRAGSTLFGAGKLDDVRLYDRALSAAEVKRPYNMGR